MKPAKRKMISFKADAGLADALRQVPNRSAFIRSAVAAALEGACPLCGGTGLLTPNQKRHWSAFAEQHFVERCATCHEFHLVCGNGDAAVGKPGDDSGGA